VLDAIKFMCNFQPLAGCGKAFSNGFYRYCPRDSIIIGALLVDQWSIGSLAMHGTWWAILWQTREIRQEMLATLGFGVDRDTLTLHVDQR
jgi:hypothetical protein